MTEEALVELVPNVSEGRDRAAIRSMAEAFSGSDGIWLLDVHSDGDHNRSVLTAVARPEAVCPSLEALARHVIDLLDLRSHRGIHPRIGALDVVPLVALAGISSEELDRLARDAAQSLSDGSNLPICLYGAMATRESHRTLAALRRGGFEELPNRLGAGAVVPDFGPNRPHPSAGVTALGTRDFLIAFNVNLKTDDVTHARSIARAVRASSGGLLHLQALGFPLERRGLVQVSMNLTDFRVTSLRDAFDAVAAAAAERNVVIQGSEIIGLIPEAAAFAGMEQRLGLDAPPGIIEECLAKVRRGGP